MYLGGIVLFILMLMMIVLCFIGCMILKEEFEIVRLRKKFLLMQYKEVAPRSPNEHYLTDWMIIGKR